MRYLSQIFQPFLTIPKNAKIKNTEITCKSQKLLLELGLVRPTSQGFFALLPLARRALNKLEALVRQSIESVGAQQVTMPALIAAHLWEKTGRLDEVGPELVRVTDRHEKDYLLAPTFEEAIADLISDVGPLSYKQLPLLLYQISNKFRDEHRPKHGMLRAREFSMLDAYGAHTSEESAQEGYQRVGEAYRRLFEKLELPVYKVPAPCGEMGGSISHEWHLCASAGEDSLLICDACHHAEGTSDPGKGSKCAKCGGETRGRNSIEVGHTFILGTKYSDPLKAHFIPPSGPSQPIVMTCYGIGITRLLAASLEALSSDTSLRWPSAIAPFNTIVIGPKEGSKECHSHGPDRVRALVSRAWGSAADVLLDDRTHLTVGKRLMMADRVGYPNIIVCGKSVLDAVPKYEVHRRGAEPQLMTMEELAASVELVEGREIRAVGENKA